MTTAAATVSLNVSVFVNCPFDPDFLDLLRAIIFTIKACGFVPRTAQDISDSGEVRITKIRELIADCDRGIHDLSAVALDHGTKLPRFNMPLELGISLGAKWYGSAKQKRKRILVLDETSHQYDASTSDISGQDIKAHGRDVERAITCVRNWLAQDRDVALPSLPGGTALTADYVEVRSFIEQMIADDRLDAWEKLEHPDFLRCVDSGLTILARGSA